MRNSEIYLEKKLPADRALYHGRRVLVAGGGAVGSYLMEYFAKLGLSPDVLDFDRFTPENAAKHGCIVRTPDDAGKNKAVCLSQRVQVLLDEGCVSNGIDTAVANLGPEAFSGYDAVVLALDNYDAKVLIGELLHRLPPERRPIAVMAGTDGETAQSVMLDEEGPCLRCLFDETWLERGNIRTSCTGPQLPDTGGAGESARTSNLASSMAAHLAAEQLRGYFTGAKNVMNCRLSYTAYPQLALESTRPMRKKHCPGCAVQPPADIRYLSGTVLHKTLDEALREISQALGTDDFEISVHRQSFRSGRLICARFVKQAACRCCGKTIPLLRHEARLTEKNLVCGECAEKNAPENPDIMDDGEMLRAFTMKTDAQIRAMTLFDLGFPLGAQIETIRRGDALDFLDDGKIERTVFACREDAAQMHIIHKL